MNRKIWLLLTLALAIILLGCGRHTGKNGEAQGNDSDVGVKYVRQLVAEDNKTGRMLVWQSDSKQPYTVEYRSLDGGKSNFAQAEDCSFQDVKAAYIQYRASLRGLQPGETYEYRINTERNKGAWYRLRADGGAAFTALIFPDSQSSDYSGWSQLARDAYKRHRDADFYINMGDLVDNGQDANQWRAWFASVEPFSADIPLAPLLGNHEAYSLEWKVTRPHSYLHFFQMPLNGLSDYPSQFYSFDYGPVHFTVLDSNFPEMEQFQPNLLEDELRWLERDLSGSAAKWKIVLLHRYIFLYGFGQESGRQQTKTRFLDFSYRLMPMFEKYNVDAVLSAHLHTYRRRVPLRNFAPAENGITYILTGVAGSVRYPKLWGDFAWDAARAPQPETANYLTLQADDSRLLFKAFLPDGKQFDEVTIKKQALF